MVKGLIGLEKQNLEWAVGQPRVSLVYVTNYPKAQELATPSTSGNRSKGGWGSRIRRSGLKS